MSQRYFLIFYTYPNSYTGPSAFDRSPYDVFRLQNKTIPSMAKLQKEIAVYLGDRLRGSIYHIRITGITETTRQEWDNFEVIDDTDPTERSTQSPPQYPGDCVLI